MTRTRMGQTADRFFGQLGGISQIIGIGHVSNLEVKTAVPVSSIDMSHALICFYNSLD